MHTKWVSKPRAPGFANRQGADWGQQTSKCGVKMATVNPTNAENVFTMPQTAKTNTLGVGTRCAMYRGKPRSERPKLTTHYPRKTYIMARYTKAEIQDAAIELFGALAGATVNGVKPTVYASVKHVSRSGMSRHIDFWVIDTFAHTPYLRKISRQIATLTGNTLTNDGVKVSGGGMDMGWHLLDYARSVAKHEGAGPYESKDDQISPHYL